MANDTYADFLAAAFIWSRFEVLGQPTPGLAYELRGNKECSSELHIRDLLHKDWDLRHVAAARVSPSLVDNEERREGLAKRQ